MFWVLDPRSLIPDPLIPRRDRDFVDDRPRNTIRAQTIGAARPRTVARGVDKNLRIPDPRSRIPTDEGKALRFLPLCVAEVRLAIKSKQRGNLRVGPRRLQSQSPPQHGRRETKRADGVPRVVLAVAEGAFAGIPRFAPDDGGQRDEEMVRLRVPAKTHRSSRRVLARRVVADASAVNDPRLGRVQVAARRVDAQRPA